MSTSTNMHGDALISPLDAAKLQAEGLLVQNADGTRRIHKRRLNRSSDEEHRNVSLLTPPDSPEAVNVFVKVPDVLISRETLLYLGFTNQTATRIWQAWTNWPMPGPPREVDPADGHDQITFREFLLGFAKTDDDASDESDAQWRACMDRCGLAPDTQAAIMDRHFDYLRLTNSCLFWVRDTVDMRYAALKDVQRTSRLREMELSRAASGSYGGQQPRGSHGAFSLGSSSSGTASNQGHRATSGQQQQGTSSTTFDNWDSARTYAASNAPGSVLLFKGLDKARAEGFLREDGSLNDIAKIISHGPADFSRNGAYYFTPDTQVAEYYAGYAKQREPNSTIVIVCIRLSNAAIESLRAPDIVRIFWPDQSWKELVWLSRRGQKPSKHLAHIGRATLIIGTIAKRPNWIYNQLGAWQDIDNKGFVLNVGVKGEGPDAVQYVINGDAEDWLVEHGGQDIKMLPFTKGDFDKWRIRYYGDESA